MLFFHLTGLISAGLYGFAVIGLWSQWRLILHRKRQTSQDYTAVVSLNFLFVSFLCYIVIFFYGLALPEINHYLTWPRLVAMLLGLFILRELMIDRGGVATHVFWICCILKLLVIFFAVYNRGWIQHLIILSQILFIILTILIVQGNLHQIHAIYQAKATGALSFHYQLFTFCKDISTVLFAVAIGGKGWPIALLCGASALCKIWIMYLFRKF